MKQSLFRSIRKRFLEQGKLLRYLTYAVGEILLIVIGILLALKINDWNEDKKAQVEYDAYVVQLKADLQLATEHIDRAIRGAERATKRNYLIIQFLEGHRSDDLNLEAFENALMGLTRVNTLDVRIGYLGRLLAGDFEMIERNRHIATEALNFQTGMLARLGIIQRIVGGREMQTQTVRQYYEAPIDLIPETKLEYDLDQMKSSGEFKNAVRSLAKSKDSYHRIALEVKALLEGFQRVLEEYE